MQPRLPISVVVITLNEERNLARCLLSVKDWAAEIVVVDSGSTDSTKEIALGFGARWHSQPWLGYGQQKNFARSKTAQPWQLFLDADEAVSDELRSSLSVLFGGSSQERLNRAQGFFLSRRTWYLGRWIMHGGWYPNRLLRLVKAGSGAWTEPEVHEELKVVGATGALEGDILHYTFANVGEQVETNIRFSRLGAKVAQRRGEKGTLGKILLKPWLKFLETYLWKLGFLDGFPGFVISVNAAHSMFMKYVELKLSEEDSTR
jgi:glycosyltransferase involved in cell wall biosynthesis